MFQRGQELELRFVGFFCPLAYVCLLGYITKIVGLCVSNLKDFEQEQFEFSSMSNGQKKLWLSELGCMEWPCGSHDCLCVWRFWLAVLIIPLNSIWVTRLEESLIDYLLIIMIIISMLLRFKVMASFLVFYRWNYALLLKIISMNIFLS